MRETTSTLVSRQRTGLVLGGGAARGAYEVGVVQHVLEEVARELGRDIPLDILSGTSVGAINASALAAYADEPRTRGRRLAEHWTQLHMGEILRADGRGIYDSVRTLFGGEPSKVRGESRRGGILDPSGIERIIRNAIPFERIERNIQGGLLQALTVSTTHVGSGRTVVFMQMGLTTPHFASDDPLSADVVTTLGPDHAAASAAIPFLFPAVRIEDDFYCDGGLRQNVPLSPAVRLGADRLLVISPRNLAAPSPVLERARERAYPGPFFLLGKALNALLLDRIDSDLNRLRGINRVLEAGVRRYGSTFVTAINRELGNASDERQLRPIETLLIQPSENIGVIAADYVRSSEFARRQSPLLVRLMRRLADANLEADLLSYVLFDGEYAARLIALGRADARARHEELCLFFDGAIRKQALAA